MVTTPDLGGLTRANADHVVKACTLKDMPLAKIRRPHVEGWVKTMSASVAASTIDPRFTIIRGVFRAAVADRVIAHDPATGVVLPRIRKTEAAMEIPTAEEVGKLLWPQLTPSGSQPARDSAPTWPSALWPAFARERPLASRSGTSTSSVVN